jgi:hypothetical protein
MRKLVYLWIQWLSFKKLANKLIVDYKNKGDQWNSILTLKESSCFSYII